MHRLALTLGWLLVAACSFRVVSTTDDASDGRDASPMDVDAQRDAQPDAPDLCIAGPCGAAGGTCMNGRCVIDHDAQSAVTCPEGMPCTVLCNMGDACKDGVDCARATDCDVTCSGTSTCQNGGVDCGMAQVCTVRCDGSNACQNGAGSNQSVECRASTCTVTCEGSSNACQEGIGDDSGGSCVAHCCDGACTNGTAVAATCTKDSDCS
jgi:hypothetical protein